MYMYKPFGTLSGYILKLKKPAHLGNSLVLATRKVKASPSFVGNRAAEVSNLTACKEVA
jgi:hypothetical protein